MKYNEDSSYKMIRDFIQDREDLPEKLKADYISCLDKFARGEQLEMDEATGLNDFLNTQIEFIEESAIDAMDTETIQRMTDIRNARLDLEEKIYSLPEEKDEKMDDLLDKISSVANSA